MPEHVRVTNCPRVVVVQPSSTSMIYACPMLSEASARVAGAALAHFDGSTGWPVLWNQSPQRCRNEEARCRGLAAITLRLLTALTARYSTFSC